MRELISYLIGAVFAEARRRLEAARPKSVDDVRNHGEGLIAFPAEVAQAEAEIKAFLKLRMYRHPRVMRVMGEAEQILFDLFARYQSSPGDLPPEWLPPDGRGQRNRTGAADRQLHRRDDRPLRDDRTSKAF